jgi:hypothetical protein
LGSTQSVAINSNPKGAKIYVDGNFVGTDFVKVELEREKDHYVEIKKGGFESERRYIAKNIQAGWVVLDIFLIELIIPIIVDAVTGAWYELSPDNINVELEPERK